MLDIRNIPGGYDLFDRISLVVLVDIVILLFLFVYEYISYRIFFKYVFYIKS